MKTRQIMIIGLLAITLGCLSGASAVAQDTHGLHWEFGIDSGAAAVIEPEAGEWSPIHMTPHSTLADTWVGEWMLDFYAPDEINPQLSSVRIERVALSEGLFPGNYFGAAHDGYMDLAADSSHKHVHFFATAPGEYWMQFKLTNGVDALGNPVGDSQIYTLGFEVVPEPSSMLALALPLAGLVIRRRR